jgi:hypothetical protein
VATTLEFLPGVAEKLGHYVYALRDPRAEAKTGGIFYIGKGLGNRAYHHARDALKEPDETPSSLKLDTIRQIHRAGHGIGVEIIRHGLSESAAEEVEAGVIDTLRLVGIPLSNKASGQHSVARGWHPLVELNALYAAKPLGTMTDRVILIKINRLYRPTMSSAELYEATRKWWRCSPNRRPELALAVYRGIVRAVYHIDRWDQAPEDDVEHHGRWAFSGHPAVDREADYIWRRVPDRFIQAQNPIQYWNC